jgi:hypothetical protein
MWCSSEVARLSDKRKVTGSILGRAPGRDFLLSTSFEDNGEVSVLNKKNMQFTKHFCGSGVIESGMGLKTINFDFKNVYLILHIPPRRSTKLQEKPQVLHCMKFLYFILSFIPVSYILFTSH